MTTPTTEQSRVYPRSRIILNATSKPKIETSDCITVVLLCNDTESRIAMGVSVCDDQDVFDPEKGLAIARGRAQKAWNENKLEFFGRRDILIDFYECGFKNLSNRKIPKMLHIDMESGRGDFGRRLAYTQHIESMLPALLEGPKAKKSKPKSKKRKA